MVDIRVILVNPKFEGNVGAVARAMANFGFDELWMVGACEIGDEARRRAKHAQKILDNAVLVETLEEAMVGCALVAGTTGIVTSGEKHYVRIPVAARDFAERSTGLDGKLGLVFGREDLGLFQEELMNCDTLITVPTAPEYPVLNLSHAVSTVLYELHMVDAPLQAPRPATGVEKEQLFRFFSDLLVGIDYPDHRRDRTEIMFRRMMGRAVPTRYEFSTLVGIIGEAAKKLRDQRS